MLLASEGGAFDVGRRLCGRRGERQQLDVEHEHAFRIALAAVRERFRNPETACFALHHRAARLRSIRRSRGRAGTSPARRAADGAVEHLSVGRPAGVVHGDEIVPLGMRLAGPGFEHLRRQPGAGLRGIRRRRRHVGRCGNLFMASLTGKRWRQSRSVQQHEGCDRIASSTGPFTDVVRRAVRNLLLSASSLCPASPSLPSAVSR